MKILFRTLFVAVVSTLSFSSFSTSVNWTTVWTCDMGVSLQRMQSYAPAAESTKFFLTADSLGIENEELQVVIRDGQGVYGEFISKNGVYLKENYDGTRSVEIRVRGGMKHYIEGCTFN